jgi:hypothetical protein
MNLKDLFKKKIIPNNEISINDDLKFSLVMSENRESLKKIINWLPKDTWENSYYGYGVPDKIFNLLDLDIGLSPSYSDLICYYGSQIKEPNYLELGVSVCKNFWQIMNYFEKATLTGFDIENFNPAIKNKISELSSREWSTKPGSLRIEKSNFKEYEYQTNKIKYLAGDIWDENSWKILEGEKFNIIFSDALHDPKALLWEYKMIEKYNLLADEFIFFWDDLTHGLEISFLEIATQLKKKYSLKNSNIKQIKINGWLGENYPIKHDVGIISNLNLT